MCRFEFIQLLKKYSIPRNKLKKKKKILIRNMNRGNKDMVTGVTIFCRAWQIVGKLLGDRICGTLRRLSKLKT